MKNKIKLFAVISAMVMALTAFGCKTDTEIEWKDKTYCSAVIFTSQATEDGVKVTMETSTEGASIYYTTDGTAPTAESTKYSEPVEFTKDATVKAIVIKEGLENSPVSVATISIKEKTITETKIEYVDKTYCSAVTFTSEATEDGVKVTMESSTEGAAIYYTTDGTIPTAKSTKYREPVEFTTDVTVKAIAIKEGLENSPVSVATVSIKEKTITETKIEYVDKTYCSAVTFMSQATEDGVKVTMATTTEGAAIYYTTDGTMPTAESTKYSEPVEFTNDATVKAIAVKTGIENSPVSVATVSIKEKTITETKIEYIDKTYCSAVIFTSQATDDGVKVTMETSTEGVAIYYTTDGTIPTAESTKYSEAVEFTNDATVKAIAIKTGIENSPVSVATVSIKEKTITETKIEYVDKTYCSAVTFTSQATDDGVKVTMETSTEGASIYYTTDGTAPTAESTKYSEAVEFTNDATVKAIAIKTGIENSPVSVAKVSIKENTIIETKTEYVDKTYCSAVIFMSQATEDGIKVTMATTTEGAAIYYTTDGTVPTENSPQYSKPVEFTKDATVKAIAVKTGIENSPVSVATVSIKEKTITVEVDKKADEKAPANVTNLAAQPKDSRVFLSWTDAADEDVYGYEVTYSGTKPISRVVLPALDSKTMMVGKGAGGCYVSGLENGTEYTFTVKTVDTSGNKSEGVTVNATPVAGETLKIALTAAVPKENGYTGNKSNTKVTVTANMTTASKVKKVVWKKDGSLIAKTLLADKDAAEATVTEDNAVWTFDITPDDESANGTYTVAAIDEAGREEAEQITIDSFDFTAPGKVKVTGADYSNESATITISWTEPKDSDYHHVDITFTSNDGKVNSKPSKAETVNKGITEITFSGIDNAKKYYTYTFVTYDELGNKGAEYSVTVSKGFVKVTGGTITGKKNTNNDPGVFIEGRTVTLSDFFMSQYEVTQEEYSEVMTGQKVTVSGTEYTLNANPSYCTEANKSEYGVNFGTEQRMRPVECVTWYDAVYYCNARSKQEGLTSAYDIIVTVVEDGNITAATVTLVGKANGYRLPTEAEWEYAARGGDPSAADWDYRFSGADTADGKSYNSASNAGLDAVGWYCYNNDTGTTGSINVVINSASGRGTHQVGQKAPNALDIYDMSGNVCEWCYDWYSDTVSTGSETDPLGSSTGSARVMHGGSWISDARYAYVCFRNLRTPSTKSNNLGFRLVRSAN